MARGVLAEGRLLDASRMIEPLLERVDKGSATNGRIDAGQLVLRCLTARIHLLRYGDCDKVAELLGSYEKSDSRAELDPAVRAEVALWLGWSRAWQDDERYDDARALNLLDEAQRAFDEAMNPSGRCWTRIAQAHAYFTIDEYKLMLQALGEAAAMQERLNDVAARAWIDHLSVAGARYEGRYSAARRHTDALEQYGHEFHDEYALGRALAHRAVIDFELGRQPAEIITTARKAESILRRSAVHPGYSLVSAYHAHIGALIRSGEWEQADPLIDEALDAIGFLGTAPAYITLHRARLRAANGAFEDALELLGEIGGRTGRHHKLLASSIGQVKADCLLRKKQFAEAREQASKALRNARDAGHIGYQVAALLLNARIAVEQGDEAEARSFVREAERHADYFSFLPLAAQRFLIHALLARLRNRPDDARAFFTQALSAFSLIGDVHSAAQVQCELARFGGAQAEVRQLLTAALRTLDRLGAAPDARRARKLLRNVPPETSAVAAESEANIGAIMARAAISVDLVAEAWLQAAEELAPGRWLVVFRCDDEQTWSLVHKHGDVPGDLIFPNPSLERICEDGVDWMRLRGLPAPAFFFGMECGGEDDPACAAIEKRLEPWIPVVGLALEHAILRSTRLGIRSTDGDDDLPLVDASLRGFVYANTSTREIAKQIRRICSGHSPVLITGESGVGKTHVARTIHETGDRQSTPFVALRCSMRPIEALESALFGAKGRKGALVAADGGTLYLEDIGDLPLRAQSRLFRFLEEGLVTSAEDESPKHVDARIVASSTNDLEQMVRAGDFHEDLYYRLSVVPIRIPPLRERREEIPILVQHFLRELTAGKPTGASVTSRALDILVRYEWPGNVRQLRNEIERLIDLAGSEPFSMIDAEDLSPSIRETVDQKVQRSAGGSSQAFCVDGKGLDDILAEAEKTVIEQELKRHGGQVSSTSDALGLTRQGLYKKMKRLGIEPSDFQSDDIEETTPVTN